MFCCKVVRITTSFVRIGHQSVNVKGTQTTCYTVAARVVTLAKVGIVSYDTLW